MHDYRRRPEDLKPEKMQELEALFEKIPLLGVIYHQRWEATRIFDTAEDRATAATALAAWPNRGLRPQKSAEGSVASPWVNCGRIEGMSMCAYVCYVCRACNATHDAA